MTLIQGFIDKLSREVEPVDLSRAALLLLDWTGCAVAGKAALQPDFLGAIEAPLGQSICIGASPSNAAASAFHNGCLGNVLEMDDVDRQAILHPGPTVIPAALSIAETQANVTARDILSAIVVGYEVTIRIGRAAGAGHYALWHSTGTCGVFGAAAAMSRLLSSDIEQALNLCGTLAAGLWQTRHDPRSQAKQIHTGHAAQTGVKCAQLAKGGARGPDGIFDGPQGFFAAMCPGANSADILKDYGDEWLIHQTSIKPYPACRHAHPAIDAALKATLADGPILIETYDDALKFCDKPNPRSLIEAKFSLQHSVAHTLVYGAPGLDDFSPEILAKTAKLRERISVKPTAEFNAAYPKHFGAAVTIGNQRFEAKDAYGDPENPMDEDAVTTKALMLMTSSGMTDKAATALCAATLSLSNGGDVSNYLKALP